MKKLILLLLIVTLYTSCKVENVVFTPKEYFTYKKWEKDTNGCKYRKFRYIKSLDSDKLNNKSQEFILKLLGEPDIKNKYKYNTDVDAVSFEYYIDCQCEKKQRIDSIDCDPLELLFLNDTLKLIQVLFID